MSPAWIRDAGAAIQRSLLAQPEVAAARRVALYLALPREAPTEDLIAACEREGREMFVPAWRRDAQAYGFAAWSRATPTRAGHYGIREPAEPAWADPAALDLVIVTALAFDPSGWRLGHGGGHFDRLLAATRGFTVCLAFECQKMTAVPSEPHDVPVRMIVTESAVYRAPQRLSYAAAEHLKR